MKHSYEPKVYSSLEERINVVSHVIEDKTVEFVPQISGQDVPVVSVEIVPLLLGN